MLTNKKIVCFGPSDWWHMNPSCATHIMRRLAESNKVLYVNPFSSDLPRKLSKGVLRRVGRKLRSFARAFRKGSKNLYTFSPIFLPVQGKGITDAINNLAVRAQVSLAGRVLGGSPDVVWIENPRAAMTLGWYRSALTVYHVSDLFSACPYARNQGVIRAWDERLTTECDLVICTSEKLYELKRSQRRGPTALGLHGVDFAAFRRVAEAKPEMPELAGLRRPIAGYFGTLTNQNDIGLLESCAKELNDVSFVLAGSVTDGDYSRLASRANVRMIGSVAQDRIPALASNFDVCLLPWKVTDWIVHCNPLKFLEYMASGRPIVTVPIPQVVSTAGECVSCAEGKEEFCRAIRWELEHDTNDRRKKRLEIARKGDWSARVKDLSRILESAIARRK